MLLYFENSKGQRRLISNPTTVSDMWKDINNFLIDHNYKSYYSRINFGKDEWVIDVSSWSEFFIVKDFDEEDLNEIRKGEWNNGNK